MSRRERRPAAQTDGARYALSRHVPRAPRRLARDDAGGKRVAARWATRVPHRQCALRHDRLVRRSRPGTEHPSQRERRRQAESPRRTPVRRFARDRHVHEASLRRWRRSRSGDNIGFAADAESIAGHVGTALELARTSRIRCSRAGQKGTNVLLSPAPDRSHVERVRANPCRRGGGEIRLRRSPRRRVARPWHVSSRRPHRR